MNEKNNKTKPEVIELTQAVEFQPNGIVSKQLLKKESGNVTLFAFDAGESLTEHTSSFDALAYVLEGEMQFTIGGKPFQVKGGELINLPANIPHGLTANKSSKMFLVMFK